MILFFKMLDFLRLIFLQLIVTIMMIAIQVFFQALESDNVANPFAAGQWKKGDIFRVKRQAPQWVGRGKLLPLLVPR